MLANVSYLALAAAARAGIPAIGFSSLNWLDIMRDYAVGWGNGPAILAEMTAAYRAASLFIRTTPSMPMPDLATIEVGTVARRGVERRDQLAERLGLAMGERVVLVSLGGTNIDLDLARWPVANGIHYVVAAQTVPPRRDMIGIDRLGLSHIDCLASCDAVLTKPGYGTLAEAACHGIPTLYVRRGGWSEESHMTVWLTACCTAREIDRAALEDGNIAPALEALWAQPRQPPSSPTGNIGAARLIADMLRS
jgi:hypothetical protein